MLGKDRTTIPALLSYRYQAQEERRRTVLVLLVASSFLRGYSRSGYQGIIP